jgi:23S rRNA pseudouridine2605 synthase
VRVEGERLKVDDVRVLQAENNAWLELRLHEGKHHEVKRLLDAVGHPVSKLKRVALGPVTARGLEPGQFRSLAPHEVRALRAGAAAPAPERSPRAPRPRPRPLARHPARPRRSRPA